MCYYSCTAVLETGGYSDMIEFVMERVALLGSAFGLEALDVLAMFAASTLFKLVLAPALFWDMFRSYGTISALLRERVVKNVPTSYRPLKAPMALKVEYKRLYLTIAATATVLVAHISLWLFAFAFEPGWVLLIDWLATGFLYFFSLHIFFSISSFEHDSLSRRVKARIKARIKAQ